MDQLDRTVTPKILTPNLKSRAVALALHPATHLAEFQIQIAPPGTSPADHESRMKGAVFLAGTLTNQSAFSSKDCSLVLREIDQDGNIRTYARLRRWHLGGCRQ
jgi:hypothetical protein